MKEFQTFLATGPLLGNISTVFGPDLHALSSVNNTSAALPFNKLSSVDSSDPAVGKLLDSQGSGGGTTEGNGAYGLRRPLQGDAQRLRVHHRHGHGKHRTDLASSQECPEPPVLSCSSAADTTDACCVVRPGGVLVHVQLWDLDIGQPESFGIHGLWPDKCNGAFYENCDSSRGYSSAAIANQLPSSLKQTMETYWLSNDESPESFWQHEWETHGTCVSTLEPSCFSNYQSGSEVVPYFQTVVSLFQQLDTYQALKGAGITPSSSTTYAAADMQNAITSGTGYTPDLVCSNGALTSVQYYLNALGPLQDGEFEQSAPTRTSSCPSQISWPPKTV